MSGTQRISSARRTTEDGWTRRWREFLPDSWREQTIEALDFTEYREYEIAARRCFGSDEDSVRCFYAHDYALEAIRSDDDEEFYPVIAYGETVRAWRLRDGRWLIYRTVSTGEAGQQSSTFYSFSEQAPY